MQVFHSGLAASGEARDTCPEAVWWGRPKYELYTLSCAYYSVINGEWCRERTNISDFEIYEQFWINILFF